MAKIRCNGNSYFLGEQQVFMGVYNPDDDYITNQIVLFDGSLYSKLDDDIEAGSPTESPDSWEAALDQVINNTYNGILIVNSLGDLNVSADDELQHQMIYVRSRWGNDGDIPDVPKLYYFDSNVDNSLAMGYVQKNPFSEDGDGCYVMRDRTIDIGWLFVESTLLTIVTPAVAGVDMGYDQVMMSREDFIASYTTFELMPLEDVLVVYDENKARQNAFIDALLNFTSDIEQMNVKDFWTLTFKTLEEAQIADPQNVLLHIEDLPKIIQTTMGCSYRIAGTYIDIQVQYADPVFLYDITVMNGSIDPLTLPTWTEHKSWYYAQTNGDTINDTSTLIKEEYLCTDGTTSAIPCG